MVTEHFIPSEVTTLLISQYLYDTDFHPPKFVSFQILEYQIDGVDEIVQKCESVPGFVNLEGSPVARAPNVLSATIICELPGSQIYSG